MCEFLGKDASSASWKLGHSAMLLSGTLNPSGMVRRSRDVLVNPRGVHRGLSGGSDSNSSTLVRPTLGDCHSCHLASLRPVSLAFPFKKLLKNI